jgi:hypothetical protein
MDDKFNNLSLDDQARLALLEADWEREGNVVFERWGKTEPAFMLKLVAPARPSTVYDAVERAVIDAGWTDANIAALMERALRERKH